MSHVLPNLRACIGENSIVQAPQPHYCPPCSSTRCLSPAKPISIGPPACLMLLIGEAPVPPSWPLTWEGRGRAKRCSGKSLGRQGGGERCRAWVRVKVEGERCTGEGERHGEACPQACVWGRGLRGSVRVRDVQGRGKRGRVRVRDVQGKG